MNQHIIQSPQWGEFKTSMGTNAIQAGGIQYTLHKFPYTGFNYAYAPKVNPQNIKWEPLIKSLKQNKCFVINFDVPNIVKNSKDGKFTNVQDAKNAEKILNEKCIKSNKNTFTKHNILLDLKPREDEILKNMHKKHRYNIRYSQKKGVTVKKATTQQDFDVFYEILKSTAERQKYYEHPKKYYQQIWEILEKKQICHIITAYFEETPLASWMLFNYNGILYYPYGGSTTEHKNLHASNLVGWEAIKLGKQLKCHTFDMWGAAKDPNDESDKDYGFTNFKLKFGGIHVEYIDSYDLVLNSAVFKTFNIANWARWKILKLLRS